METFHTIRLTGSLEQYIDNYLHLRLPHRIHSSSPVRRSIVDHPLLLLKYGHSQ